MSRIGGMEICRERPSRVAGGVANARGNGGAARTAQREQKTSLEMAQKLGRSSLERAAFLLLHRPLPTGTGHTNSR